MSDVGAILVGLLTNPSFGIPLLLVLVVVLFWVLARFNHLPPLFRALGPDRSRVLGPFAWVREAASADRIAPAVAYTSFRVHEVLRKRYGMAFVPSGSFWWIRRRFPEELEALVRVSRELDATYRLAWFSERGDTLDFISRWRRPRMRRQARARFAAALAELEPVLPRLEGAS